MRPPRALYCDFPLGRPLGRPHDRTFQRRVLEAALALLHRSDGPVFDVFPETVTDHTGAAELTCPVPARYDESVPTVVAEAAALRPAWDRARALLSRTEVGRVCRPDEVPAAVARFVALAEGVHWSRAGFGSESELTAAALDIRAYYEEAAVGLAGHVPAARVADTWFFRSTRAGELLRACRRRLETSDPPVDPVTIYTLVPVAHVVRE
jgi:hypothetical protein